VAMTLGSGNSYANAVVVQPDGKIIAAGQATFSQTGRDFLLVRYNADGSPDSSFGTNGVVTTDFGKRDDAIAAVVLPPDRKILAVGTTNIQKGFTYASQLVLARYLPSGALDTSFGNRGTVKTAPSGSTGNNTGLSDVALQSDGKIVVAGTITTSVGGDNFLA